MRKIVVLGVHCEDGFPGAIAVSRPWLAAYRFLIFGSKNHLPILSQFESSGPF
jgi:hypothetical protein